MRRLLIALVFLLAPMQAFAIGPLETSGERQVAQLVSDGTLGTALFLDTWHALNSQDPTVALFCEGAKDAAIGAVGLLGQHFITSPRPDGTGNGMPSIHSAFSAGTIATSGHPIATAFLTAATMAGRYLGARHTFKQTAVGAALGFGISIIPCH